MMDGRRLEGRSAIVTAAGSGIGRATALAFAREGARLALNDVDAERLEAVAAEARDAGAEVATLAGDASARATNDALVALAVERHGRLDVADFVAGGAAPQPTLDTDETAWRRILALNLDSVWFGAQAAVRAMRATGGGAIVATSSGAGLGAVPGLAAYGAAKAGVVALVRSLALEFGRDGVRANAISPGPIATPQLAAALDRLPSGLAGFAAQVPLGRLGTPEEIADAAVFLASDEARYVSGALLCVDGAVHSTLATPSPMAPPAR